MSASNIRKFCLVLLLAIFQLNAFASPPLLIDGSTGVKPLIESLAKHYMQVNPSTPINVGIGLNPKDRIAALLDNKIHIAMASHGIDVQQVEKHELVVHQIAKMAVVFGVNQNVKVSDISQLSLCRIYSSEITNWQALSGSNLTINPFTRPYYEVDSEVVSAHIPCFAKLQNLANIPTMKKSGQMAKALAQTPGAIGMTTLVRVSQSNGAIRALSIEGIQPTSANIASGVYSLARDAYLITTPNPIPEVTDFLKYVRSHQGALTIISNNAAPAS